MFTRFESSTSSSAAGFLAHTSMRRGILSILQTNSEAITGFLRVVPSFRGGGGGVPGFLGCSGFLEDVPGFLGVPGCSGVPCSRVLAILTRGLEGVRNKWSWL